MQFKKIMMFVLMFVASIPWQVSGVSLDTVYATAVTGVAGVGAVVGYGTGRIIHTKVSLVCAAIGATAGLSFVQGVYNTQRDYQRIETLKAKYGIVDYLPWYGFLMSHQDTRDEICAHVCTQEVQKKIGLFEAIDAEIIWNFEKFKRYFPHMEMQTVYGVAKNYLSSFGYKTIGELKVGVAFHLEELEKDIKFMLNSTNLPSRKMVKSFHDFADFQLQLAQASSYSGAYVGLGLFGYSALYNGNRIKICITTMLKMHSYLLQLQELLKSCMENNETPLIQGQGFVKFSLC